MNGHRYYAAVHRLLRHCSRSSEAASTPPYAISHYHTTPTYYHIVILPHARAGHVIYAGLTVVKGAARGAMPGRTAEFY